MQKKIYRFLFFCALSPTLEVFAQSTWNVNGNGDWSTAANWNPSGVPNSDEDAVIFGNIITAPVTVTLINAPTSPTVFAITFNSAQTYTIGSAGSGPIQLQGTIDAYLTCTSGTHIIAANVDLEAPQQTQFIGPSSLTISGNVTGSAATMPLFIQSGTLNLTGVNTYTVGTLIGDATLSGNTSGLQGAITTNSSSSVLSFSQASSGTFSGSITGTLGTVQINAPSQTITFTGNNSGFSGNTAIGSSTILNVGASNAFPLGPIAMAAGSTLQAGADFSSSSSSSITLTGSNTFDSQNFTMTLLNPITGTGSLTKIGAGIAILGGANNYTGPTTITAGTLQGSAASPQSLQGNISVASGASLVFNETAVGTYSGVLSGAGSLVVQGGSRLIMNGNNNPSFTGSTTINGSSTLQLASSTALGTGALTLSGGTLQSGASSLSIPNTMILTGSSNTIDTNGHPITVSGSISGSGNLTVQGGSTLTIAGNSPAFTGTTQVINSSTLLLNGNLQGSAVTVASGSTLQGSGAVGGGTTIMGQLIPGTNGSGALSVGGALTFSGAPSFLVSFTPTTNGAVNALGEATLAGTVIVSPNVGSSFFGVSETYTILTGSSLAGAFNPSVISTDLFFTGSLSYTPTSVLLTLFALQPFLDFPYENVNERNVGTNINAFTADPILSDMTAALDALAGQSTAVVNNALDQMHPAALSAFAEIQAEIGGQLLSMFHRGPALSGSCNKPNRIWVEPFGDWLKAKDRGIEIGFWSKTRGVAFGYDRKFFDCWVVGVGGAWNASSVKWFKDRGYAYLSGLYGSLYSDLFLGNFYLGGAVYGGKDWYSTARHIRFTTVDRQAKARSSGLDVAGQVTSAYFFGNPACLLYPYATFDWLYLKNSSFQEKGADSFNLHVRDYTSKTLRLETGVALQWIDENAAGTLSISPMLSMGYVWEKPYRDHFTSTFEGQTIPFTSYGWHRAWNLLNLRFGLKLTYRCLFLDSQYIGDISMDDHAFLVNQRANFRLGFNF